MVLKPCQYKKDRKFEPAAPKMVSFSQLPAVKEDTNLLQLAQLFGSSHFVTALTLIGMCYESKKNAHL